MLKLEKLPKAKLKKLLSARLRKLPSVRLKKIFWNRRFLRWTSSGKKLPGVFHAAFALSSSLLTKKFSNPKIRMSKYLYISTYPHSHILIPSHPFILITPYPLGRQSCRQVKSSPLASPEPIRINSITSFLKFLN